MLPKKKLLRFGLGAALIVVLLLVGRHYQRVQDRQEFFEYALESLHDPDAKVRVQGIDVLCKSFREEEMETVIPAVIPLLRDEDASVRSAASQCLCIGSRTDGLWNDKQRVAEVLPHLARAIKDGTKEPQEGWCVVMVAIGEPAIPPLIEALHDKKTRQTAATALGHIGVKAVPALIEALKEGGEVGIFAVSALHEIGRPAAEPLLDALRNSPDAEVRAGCAKALQKAGQGVEGAVPALMAALKDDSEKVKSAAGRALAILGKDAEPALLDALKNDAELRSRVASIIHDSLCLTQAVPTIVDLLRNNDDPPVRHSAAFVLRQYHFGEEKIPGLVTQGVPALIEALHDEAPRVRQNAAMALGVIQHDVSETVPALVAVLKNDTNRTARSWAACALGNIGTDARRAVASLVEALQTDSEVWVRGHAAQALGKIGPDAGEAITPLINALQNGEDHTVRANAATALGEIEPSAERAIATLKDGLNDESTVVRGRCALVLWTQGITSENVLSGLDHATRDGNEPEIREAARKALKEVQDVAKPAADAEDDASSHSNSRVPRRAPMVIKRGPRTVRVTRPRDLREGRHMCLRT